jgi:hypothetical protein
MHQDGVRSHRKTDSPSALATVCVACLGNGSTLGGYSFYRHSPPLCRIGERVGSLAQDGEISPVTEHPPPFAPGDFLDDAEPLQIGERGIDRGS